GRGARLLWGGLAVVQHGARHPAPLVLDQPAAGRTAELAKLDGVLDEPLRIADERAGGLDRAIDAVTVHLVVLVGGPQRLAAAGAARPNGTVALGEGAGVGDVGQDGQARTRERFRLAAQALRQRRATERSRRRGVHAQVLAFARQRHLEDLARGAG